MSASPPRPTIARDIRRPAHAYVQFQPTYGPRARTALGRCRWQARQHVRTRSRGACWHCGLHLHTYGFSAPAHGLYGRRWQTVGSINRVSTLTRSSNSLYSSVGRARDCSGYQTYSVHSILAVAGSNPAGEMPFLPVPPTTRSPTHMRAYPEWRTAASRQHGVKVVHLDSYSLVGVVGHHDCFTRSRSPVRTWYETVQPQCC